MSTIFNDNDEEPKDKVTITNEDCLNVYKYCDHFKVPMSESFKKALQRFEKDNTYKNQLDIKLEMCKWILSSDHENFKDSLWEAPKKSAESLVFNLQFDKDLNDELTDKKDE
jgi:hypothetical protein